jgi:hypothetical protein
MDRKVSVGKDEAGLVHKDRWDVSVSFLASLKRLTLHIR